MKCPMVNPRVWVPVPEADAMLIFPRRPGNASCVSSFFFFFFFCVCVCVSLFGFKGNRPLLKGLQRRVKRLRAFKSFIFARGSLSNWRDIRRYLFLPGLRDISTCPTVPPTIYLFRQSWPRMENKKAVDHMVLPPGPLQATYKSHGLFHKCSGYPFVDTRLRVFGGCPPPPFSHIPPFA